MSTDHTLRDGMIHNARESRRADETRILQKVNLANREAFVQRMPGQLEHVLRLLMERLQNCLTKPQGTELANPDSWPASADEIAALARSIWHLEQVRHFWPVERAE